MPQIPPDLYRTLLTYGIVLLGLVALINSFLAWKVFLYYGTYRAMLFIVIGFVQYAIAWGFVNGATELLLDLERNMRNWLILTSIIILVIGSLSITGGLGEIYYRILQFRKRNKALRRQ